MNCIWEQDERRLKRNRVLSFKKKTRIIGEKLKHEQPLDSVLSFKKISYKCILKTHYFKLKHQRFVQSLNRAACPIILFSADSRFQINTFSILKRLPVDAIRMPE